MAVELIIAEELDLLKAVRGVTIGGDVRMEVEEGIQSSTACLLWAQDDHGREPRTVAMGSPDFIMTMITTWRLQCAQTSHNI